MGAGLGGALAAAGSDVTYLVRSDRPAPPGAGLSVGSNAWGRAVESAAVVIIATPDGAVHEVASELSRVARLTGSHVVLHLSGRHDRSVLQPLEPSGAALGSLHPLQSVPDPARAIERLRGSYAGVDGDERAMDVADALARAAGMTPFRISMSARRGYHAAAAMTANFTVALYDVACRIAVRSGVPADAVPGMYLALLRGTVENLAELGPEEALTGAIRRGDVETVEAHLAALEEGERILYRAIGREALRLAEAAGLDRAAAARVAAVLEADGA